MQHRDPGMVWLGWDLQRCPTLPKQARPNPAPGLICSISFQPHQAHKCNLLCNLGGFRINPRNPERAETKWVGL